MDARDAAHHRQFPPCVSTLLLVFLPLCSPATVFLDKQGGFIGSRYKKVVYRQFTNDRFNTEVPRGADMKHLGIMGKETKAKQQSVELCFFEGEVWSSFFLLAMFFLTCCIFPSAQGR